MPRVRLQSCYLRTQRVHEIAPGSFNVQVLHSLPWQDTQSYVIPVRLKSITQAMQGTKSRVIKPILLLIPITIFVKILILILYKGGPKQRLKVQFLKQIGYSILLKLIIVGFPIEKVLNKSQRTIPLLHLLAVRQQNNDVLVRPTKKLCPSATGPNCDQEIVQKRAIEKNFN